MNDKSEFVIFFRLLIKEKQVAAVNELYYIYIWGLWTFSLSKLYFWRLSNRFVCKFWKKAGAEQKDPLHYFNMIMWIFLSRILTSPEQFKASIYVSSVLWIWTEFYIFSRFSAWNVIFWMLNFSAIIYSSCHICTTRNFAGSRYLDQPAQRAAPTKKNHFRWRELIKKIILL